MVGIILIGPDFQFQIGETCQVASGIAESDGPAGAVGDGTDLAATPGEGEGATECVGDGGDFTGG